MKPVVNRSTPEQCASQPGQPVPSGASSSGSISGGGGRRPEASREASDAESGAEKVAGRSGTAATGTEIGAGKPGVRAAGVEVDGGTAASFSRPASSGLEASSPAGDRFVPGPAAGSPAGVPEEPSPRASPEAERNVEAETDSETEDDATDGGETESGGAASAGRNAGFATVDDGCCPEADADADRCAAGKANGCSSAGEDGGCAGTDEDRVEGGTTERPPPAFRLPRRRPRI
ncbi:hypothetical protein [Catenuloplanes indicus]|uniref:Uncharacterized protein n=1 Tax=Catenuloplanes indicus TaxID=137267 RepID=A0AAE3W1T9_9ACTN|nr:hypothetical protein [Catenuloplanes indicus]MDQ0367760.1 hypothetical protein [Catenuloplanes indicus]